MPCGGRAAIPNWGETLALVPVDKRENGLIDA